MIALAPEQVRLPLTARIAALIEGLMAMQGPPPVPGDSANPDDETMIQVALLCCPHF